MRYRAISILADEDGVLTFEWILLITVLVIGIVGGLSAVRDAIVSELGDIVEAAVSLDQSYVILEPWEIKIPNCQADSASGSSYQDSAGMNQRRIQTGDKSQDQDPIGDCSPFIERPYL